MNQRNPTISFASRRLWDSIGYAPDAFVTKDGPTMVNPNITVATFVYLIAGNVAVNASLVDVTAMSWEFYQGGYVQEDVDSWHHEQQHVPGSPKHHVLSMTLGPAIADSEANMDIVQTEAAGTFNFSATFALSVFAEADNGFPAAAAQAFSGVSAFEVHFQVHADGLTYMGPEPLWSGAETFPSGSVLSPGLYSFWYSEAFPSSPYFVQTPMIENGDSVLMYLSGGWDFSFTLPSPAAMWLFLLGGLLGGTRQRIT
jgi:hypothetical protein